MSYNRASITTEEFIARGTEIRIVPQLAGCRFNPPSTSILLLEDWHRVDFRLQAKSELPDYQEHIAVNGRVAFYVGPLLVAEVKLCATFENDLTFIIDDSLVQSTANLYKAIFVSYAHEDTSIVEQLEKAYTVLGMKYFRDVHSLRSGEAWHPTLLNKIEEADIFQLCWSHAAKDSSYVENEWRHALLQERPTFIRPVHWEHPMPLPPSELAHLHFAYINLDE